MHKINKSSSWFIQFILICLLWQLAFTMFGDVKHRSMDIYKAKFISDQDLTEVIIFVSYVVINEVLKKLDSGYQCPVYCEVKHKHINWEIDEAEKSNISSDDDLPRPDKSKSGEQSEGNIRPIASND